MIRLTTAKRPGGRKEEATMMMMTDMMFYSDPAVIPPQIDMAALADRIRRRFGIRRSAPGQVL